MKNMVNESCLKYQDWLSQNVSLTELSVPSSLKKLTLHLALGRNYRVITEENTRAKLLITYAWLADLYEKARDQYGEYWQEQLLQTLPDLNIPPEEKKNLSLWLLGLTRKTAQNLEIKPANFPEFLHQ